MELMSMLCWMMVLPSVALVTVQHVLDCEISMQWMAKYTNGLADKVFTYLAINHRWVFKTRLGHSAIHGVVAVAALLTQVTK